MALTVAGRNWIAGAITGAETALFNNTNAKIGVGDSTTAFANTQTNLQGTNKLRKAMDTGYPTRSTNILTFQSTFTGTEANFAWNEWGVFNNVTDGSGTMLNRLVEYNGTKLSGQTWVFQVELTINLA